MNSAQALRQSRMIAGYRAPLFGEIVEGRGCGVGVDGGVDRFHVSTQRVPVLLRRQPERVADQMDDAALHRGQRPHVADDLGQALEAVTDQEEHVVDPAVLEVGKHSHPELRALSSDAGPQTENVLVPGQSDADSSVDGPVGDLAVANP
jgi:hypothetical protein